ncbi:MAG: hypothetical protein ACETVN_02905, partial [Asgard group archaeon]
MIYTGSPWVGITPYDALGLNIPFSALRVASEYPIVNFGGHKFKRLLLTDVHLLMRDETGQIAQFNISSVSVLKPTKKLRLKEFKGVPSVLGIDF